MGWAEEEFETLELGDVRLKRRAVLLAERLSQKPGASIPGACANWSETVAAYRFLDNEGVSWDDVMAAHLQASHKQLYTQGITEAGCWAHARRKFFDLHASSQSPMAAQALAYSGQLYEVEREAREQAATAQQRGLLRQAKSKPLLDAMHAWMQLMRQKVMDNSAAAKAKALDYSLCRWAALSRFLDDPQLPIDNNRIENLIRSIALGKKLVVRRFAQSRAAGGGHHESDSVGPHEWA